MKYKVRIVKILDNEVRAVITETGRLDVDGAEYRLPLATTRPLTELTEEEIINVVRSYIDPIVNPPTNIQKVRPKILDMEGKEYVVGE